MLHWLSGQRAAEPVNRADGSGHRAWPSVIEGRILRDPSDARDENMLKIELARRSMRASINARAVVVKDGAMRKDD